MTVKELEQIIEKCKDEAIYQYKQGNIKGGKKAEKEMKYFKSLLELY
ncbi:MAG: hypothetical protein MJZ37_06410 [Bacilli bacterium]|nr:hypothetical protein [Bacilli bacterium]